MRAQVALGSHARDFCGHVEQRVRNLARDHIDLVGGRDGDQHLGVLRAGLGEHVGIGAVTDKAAHVEAVRDALDEARARVDDRDVIVLRGEPLGNAEADLAGPADDYAHGVIVRSID